MKDVILAAALLSIGCQETVDSSPEPMFDASPPADAASCESAEPETVLEAEAASEALFSCLHPTAEFRTICVHRPHWLLSAESHEEGIQGVWTIGRPVSDCEARDNSGEVLSSTSWTLEPITLAPLRVTWGEGRLSDEPCLLELLRMGDEAAAQSVDGRAEHLRDLATCTPRVKTVVECWGPARLNGYLNVVCRLQFIELDAAIVATYALDDE